MTASAESRPELRSTIKYLTYMTKAMQMSLAEAAISAWNLARKYLNPSD
jgi:hypothetical protein